MSWDVTMTNSGGNGGDAPAAGNYPAALIGLIDLGHHDEEYKGDRFVAHKVLFAWELTGEMKPDGTPFVVTRDFNMQATLGKKSALRQMLESWRGGPFDDKASLGLDKLLGKPCLINITVGKSAKGNEYAKVDSITPLPKGMPIPRPSYPPYEWQFGTGRDFEPPDWLPYLYGRSIDEHLAESYEGRGLAVPERPAPGSKGPGPAVPLGIPGGSGSPAPAAEPPAAVAVANGATDGDSWAF